MSSRQKRAGEASRAATRARLVDAAATAFLEGGYSATTVTELARRAEVSLQTLYLAVGNKRLLLRAVLEQALAPRGDPAGGIGESYRRELRAQAGAAHRGADDPPARVRAIAHVFRTVAERAAPWWRLYRHAAATEPEIAADWAELQRLRRGTLAALLDDVPDDALRTGLTRDRAVDTLWVLASPETYELLVERAGYSLDGFEGWLGDTLAGVLLG